MMKLIMAIALLAVMAGCMEFKDEGLIVPTITQKEKDDIFKKLKEIKDLLTSKKKNFSAITKDQKDFMKGIGNELQELKTQNSNTNSELKKINSEIEKDRKENQHRDELFLKGVSDEKLAEILENEED